MTTPERPSAREAAGSILPDGALESLEREGLAVVWGDDLKGLRQEASEARRLHKELQELREAINRQYQGKPLKS